jgi:GNAT superfamily N-acetyltransferase
MTTAADNALDTDAAMFALGNETIDLLGATFVRNRTSYDIYDANHVQHARPQTPDEIEQLLAALEREYTHCRHRRFDTDYRTPPEFTARLALDGYEREDTLMLLLEGPLTTTAPAADIRPVETDSDWEAYFELERQDFREHLKRIGRKEKDEVVRRMFNVKRAKQPPVQNFMAYVKERPVAYFNSWAGVGGVGQVEDLFTLPKFRNRGIARALIHHCVADARAKGAGPVCIASDPTDTPKQIYARMGFRPVAIHTKYLKRLDG